MNVYIATKFENKSQFRELASLLGKYGHNITHDWTNEDLAGIPPSERAEFLKSCAFSDFLGVTRADVLVFIPVKEAMAGAWVEFGLALRDHKPIIVIDNKLQNNIFYNMDSVSLAKDFNHVASLLAERERLVGK